MWLCRSPFSTTDPKWRTNCWLCYCACLHFELLVWTRTLPGVFALYNLYATALHRRRSTVCSALLSNGPQQTLRRYRVRPYLERRFWTRPGRTSAWWDNFVHEVVIPEEWLLGTRLSGQLSGVEAAFQCGQRNSLKRINVDREHFIRCRGKSCVFKFIRLIVDVA